MRNENNLLVFGEVLFDDFGTKGMVLGGAPFNVAWHLQGFDLNPLFVSRIGADQKGKSVTKRMQQWGMTLAGMQTDRTLPTGLVSVDITESEPKFNILADQAYDRIQISGEEKFLSDFSYDIVYHGTLALRDDISYASLQNIIEQKDCKIFLDVNLRQPWWQAERLMACISRATWIKCNHEEFKIIIGLAGIRADDQKRAAWQLCQMYDLDLILITMGAQGALIVDFRGNLWQGEPVKVDRLADSVGAGDGFSAISLLGLHSDWKTNLLLDRAIDFAAQICRIRGATVNDAAFYQKQLSKWK